MKELKDLTLDQLLGLLGDSDSNESLITVKKPRRSTFIKDFKIIPGPDKIPNYLIFYYYRRIWRKELKKKSKIGFFREFNKLYESGRTNSYRFYYLDNSDNIFDMSEESLSIAKKYESKYNIMIKSANSGGKRGRKKKTKKKKQKK